jgi:hypothetical protein
MKISVAIASVLLSLFAYPARADNCAGAAVSYAQQCTAPPDEKGLSLAATCNSDKFEEAKTNFLWASKRDPGAVGHFRFVFDHCEAVEDVVERNIYSAILSQTHNLRALCTIADCWESGELLGYLQSEHLLGRLYVGNASPQPKTKPICDLSQKWCSFGDIIHPPKP